MKKILLSAMLTTLIPTVVALAQLDPVNEINQGGTGGTTSDTGSDNLLGGMVSAGVDKVLQIVGGVLTWTDSLSIVNITISGAVDPGPLVIGKVADTVNQILRMIRDTGTVNLTWDGTTLGIDQPISVTGDVDATSFTIGANTLDTNEWAFLDGQDQVVGIGDSPIFLGTNITAIPAASILAGTFGTGSYTIDTNLTLGGDLAVNGNDITSTGKLTITPASGDSLNVILATTGDFVVNTGDLFVDTSTRNVGIRTTSPDGTLHVQTASAGVIGPASAADDITAENSSDGGMSILVPNLNTAAFNYGSPGRQVGAFHRWNFTSNLFIMGTGNTGAEIAFATDINTEAVRIDSSGNVGIGTAAPADPLHIIADSGGDNIRLEENSGGEFWQLGVNALGHLNFKAGGTNRVTFEDNGDVGIGTTNPQNLFHVSAPGPTISRFEGTDANSVVRIQLENPAQRWDIELRGGTGNLFRVRDNKAATNIFIIEAGALTNSLYIDSTGNLGVGKANATAQLHVDQSSTTGAKPVITLDQADVDEDFFKFIGTSDTSVDRALVDAANFTTPGSIVGWLKINIQDDQGTAPIVDGDYYIPFYSAPTP